MPERSPTRSAIRRWFDDTYADRGLGYLRPPEFYSIFPAYLEAEPGQSLLDIGCGPGLLLEQAVESGLSTYGVDVSTQAVAMASRRVPTARVGLSDGEKLCFRESRFDFVTCVGVFEHFPDPDAALSEMKRVLEPTGKICLQVPNAHSFHWQLDTKVLRAHENDSNENAATLDSWRSVFESNGLEILRLQRDPWRGFAFRRRLLRGLAKPFAANAHGQGLLPLRWVSQFVFVLSQRPPA